MDRHNTMATGSLHFPKTAFKNLKFTITNLQFTMAFNPLHSSPKAIKSEAKPIS
jgi:hypothetical protein